MRIILRTIHLIGMAFLVGGVAQGLPMAELRHAYWTTVGSGLLFVAAELFSTFIWLFQLKGWAVIIKMGLLAGAMLVPDRALAFLITAIVIGGISSHMSGRYRYYSLIHRRVMKERD